MSKFLDPLQHDVELLDVGLPTDSSRPPLIR
jgi:hypothetical protein